MAANSLLKLTVESSEYDAKLKKAAEGIRHLADRAHESAGDMTGLEKSTLEYIKAVGEMETKSRSAAGQVRELESSYKELKVVYDQLNDAEKADEGGKALAASLDQLKQRAQDARKSLDDASKSLSSNEQASKEDGSSISDLTSKLGINIKSLVGWGAALGVGTVALNVMKDAFFKSETSLDEWGRTVQSSESLYSSFLSALNNTDISEFLNRIDDIVSAAREAYDAMDDLNTYKAFSRGRTAGLRSNYTEALNEYKLHPTAENKQALDAANKALITEMQTLAGKYKTNYETSLTSLGIDRLLKGEQLTEFMDLFKSGDYDKLQALKSSYKSGRGLNAGAQYWYGDRVYDGRIQDRSTGKWRDLDEAERKQFEFARVLNQVNDKEIDAIQALDEQYKTTLDAINNQNRQYNRLAGNNGKVVGGSGNRKNKDKEKKKLIDGSIGKFEADIADLRKAQKDVTTNEEWEALQHQIGKLTIKVKELKGELKTVPASISDATNKATDAENKKIQERLNDPNVVSKGMAEIVKQISKEQNKDNKKNDKKLTDGLSALAGGLGGIQSGFNQLGIDLGSGFNDVVNGIQGITSILTAIQSIVTAIEIISSVKFFSHGGIVHAAGGYVVPGHQYSGDLVPAALSSGEMVLNKQQQMILAGTLENGGMKNIIISGHLEGETIALSIDRWGKRSGRGELAFWKNQ